MRNFSKTLISMAAVMAVGSAMAAGAMAADLTATYADGTVSIEGVTAGKSQYTLLVVQGEIAEGTTDYKYYAKTTTIKQIDQNDAGVPFTSTYVGALADGSYKVLVGNNDGTVDTGIFVVGGTEEPDLPEVEPETIIVGDVNDDSTVEIGNLNLGEFGVESLFHSIMSVPALSDGANGLVMANIDTTGAVVRNDIVKSTTANSGLYINEEITCRYDKMLDSFCDKFYWERIE
jgi:hypothetical protein